MRLKILLMIVLLTSLSYASEERTIQVGRCMMNVLVMITPDEHARGLLGYTAQTFEYDGMLFEMNRGGRKFFHTKEMLMPIRIMGVAPLPDGTYKVVTKAYLANPGIDSIPLSAPDVLEIPEARYKYRFKQCLLADEAVIK